MSDEEHPAVPTAQDTVEQTTEDGIGTTAENLAGDHDLVLEPQFDAPLPYERTLVPPAELQPAEPRPVGRIALFFTLLMLAIGLFVALRAVGIATLSHILQPAEYVFYQEVTDGLPVPRLLDWNLGQIDVLDALRQLNGGLLLLVQAAVFGTLWVACVRILNPTFRLLRRASDPILSPSKSSDIQPLSPTLTSSTSPDATPTNTVVSTPDPLSDPSSVSSAVFDPSSLSETFVSHSSLSQPSVPHPSGLETGEAVTQAAAYPQPILPVSEATPEPESRLSAAENLPFVAANESKLVTAVNTVFNPALEGRSLAKALILLVLLGLPVLLVWTVTEALAVTTAPNHANLLLDFTGHWSYGWLLRMVALGVALWVGFDRNGVAGDFGSTGWNRSRGALSGLALRGAAFGVGTFLLVRYGYPGALEPVLVRFQMLGTFNLDYWHQIAASYLLSGILVWIGCGLLFLLIALPRLTRPQTALLLVFPLLTLAAAMSVRNRYSQNALAARYDITPDVARTVPVPYNPIRPSTGVPDGPGAARELAKLTKISSKPEPDRNLVVFYPNLTHTLIQSGFSVDGLTTDPATLTPVRNFLRGRNYRTALSWAAIKHIFNVSATHFDTTGAIDACMLDLIYCPHSAQCERTIRAMLAICAASKQNRALLDTWGDERYFSHPDRDSRRLMGDLYRRMGVPDKALEWYTRAEMPESFRKRVRAEKPVFNSGRVTGVLELNGKPLAGVQVAVVPIRMNGLPSDLPPAVLDAIGDIDYQFPRANADAFHPPGFSFRWVSAAATTDNTGAYSIDSLTEGEYVVFCTLPTSVKASVPFDEGLHITHAPKPFTVSYKNPVQAMGTTQITYKPAP